jgi:RimJ/RimL family protein N-acetyltransferase
MNPILLDFPDQFKSARLLIRCPRPGDGAMINAAVVESFAELTLWMPWAKTLPSVENTEEYVRNAHANFITRKALPLIFLRKSDGMFVGSSGLHDIDWDVPKFEIGYWVRTSLSRQGYVSEAVNAITAFCFDNLKARRVQIRMDDRNDKSWRVAERCGFTLEGTLHNDALGVQGDVRSTRFYAKVK